MGKYEKEEMLSYSVIDGMVYSQPLTYLQSTGLLVYSFDLDTSEVLRKVIYRE